MRESALRTYRNRSQQGFVSRDESDIIRALDALASKDINLKAHVDSLEPHLVKDQRLVTPLIFALSYALDGQFAGSGLQLQIVSTARAFLQEYPSLLKEHENLNRLIDLVIGRLSYDEVELLISLKKYMSNQDQILYPAALVVAELILNGRDSPLLDLARLQELDKNLRLLPSHI